MGLPERPPVALVGFEYINGIRGFGEGGWEDAVFFHLTKVLPVGSELGGGKAGDGIDRGLAALDSIEEPFIIGVSGILEHCAATAPSARCLGEGREQ